MGQEELVPAVCPDATHRWGLTGTGKKQFGQTLRWILLHQPPRTSPGSLLAPKTQSQEPGSPLTPGPAGLTAGDKLLGGAGFAIGVADRAAVLPAVLGPHATDLQPQSVTGCGDAEPLLRGRLRPAGRQQGAVAVKGHGGRRVAVHGAADDGQPAALRLLEDRDGGRPGGVCGRGEDAAAREVPAVQPLPERLHVGHVQPRSAQLLLRAAFPLRKRVIFTHRNVKAKPRAILFSP